MKTCISAGTIILVMGLGMGAASAVELPQGPTQQSRVDIAHDRTIAAAARAYDASAAATGMCQQDQAQQTRLRVAAARRDLDVAARAEAQFDPAVARAQIAAIQAGLAENGIHSEDERARLAAATNARWDAYGKLQSAKAKEIAAAALQVAARPGQANAVCPPSAVPERTAAIPSLPATPAKSIRMLNSFDDRMFKATLVQPSLRVRVETLMGLGGCDFSADAAVSRSPATRRAAAYLNRMNDDDLHDTLSSGPMLDRIDAAFGRGECNVAGPDNNPVTPFPPAYGGQNGNDGRYPYEYPYGYPYAYGRYPYGPGPILPPNLPSGGYGPSSIP
jgi:hypothetical protein